MLNYGCVNTGGLLAKTCYTGSDARSLFEQGKKYFEDK